MTPHRRSPRPLSFALDRMRDELAPQTLLADIQTRWLDAVGPTIAREAHPVSERNGVLTVSCSASVWAQELDLMSPMIIERLNGFLRGSAVSRLRCVAVPPRDPD